MPLSVDDAEKLVNELADLALSLQTANYATQKQAVEEILKDQNEKLLRPGWQDAWRVDQVIYWAWFGDITFGTRVWQFCYDRGDFNRIEDDRTWQLLLAVFYSLMRLNFSAVSPFLQRQYAEECLKAVAEFLGQVDVALPTPDHPNNCITLAQGAELCMKDVQTLRNYGTEGRPEPLVPARGRKPALFSYFRFREWLLNAFPEMTHRLPENPDEAMRILTGKEVSNQ